MRSRLPSFLLGSVELGALNLLSGFNLIEQVQPLHSLLVSAASLHFNKWLPPSPPIATNKANQLFVISSNT